MSFITSFRKTPSAAWARELIEKQKDEIYSAAARSAKERVKLAFLIQRIAEKEDIQVSQEEVLRRVQSLAAMYQIPPDKFIKDLQKRNGVNELYDQIAHEKVLDFSKSTRRSRTCRRRRSKIGRKLFACARGLFCRARP